MSSETIKTKSFERRQLGVATSRKAANSDIPKWSKKEENGHDRRLSEDVKEITEKKTKSPSKTPTKSKKSTETLKPDLSPTDKRERVKGRSTSSRTLRSNVSPRIETTSPEKPKKSPNPESGRSKSKRQLIVQTVSPRNDAILTSPKGEKPSKPNVERSKSGVNLKSQIIKPVDETPKPLAPVEPTQHTRIKRSKSSGTDRKLVQKRSKESPNKTDINLDSKTKEIESSDKANIGSGISDSFASNLLSDMDDILAVKPTSLEVLGDVNRSFVTLKRYNPGGGNIGASSRAGRGRGGGRGGGIKLRLPGTMDDLLTQANKFLGIKGVGVRDAATDEKITSISSISEGAVLCITTAEQEANL